MNRYSVKAIVEIDVNATIESDGGFNEIYEELQNMIEYANLNVGLIISSGKLYEEHLREIKKIEIIKEDSDGIKN